MILERVSEHQMETSSHAIDFEVLYMRLREQVIRYLTRVVGNRDLAEELSQEVFLRAWRAKEAGSYGDAWVYCIARNLAIDTIRQDRRFRASMLTLTNQLRSTVIGDGQPEQHVHIYETLGRLSYEERDLLNLFYLTGYSLKHLATIQCVPINTIKTRLFRARAAFRRAY